jgi:hypothetical protein
MLAYCSIEVSALLGILTVVFNQGVGRPSVDCEVRVPLRLVRPLVVDVTRGTCGPALAANEVTATAPFYAVLARGTVGVRHIRTAIGPEGVVVTVVGAGGRGRGARGKVTGSTPGEIGGCGEGTCESSRRREEGSE